LTYEKAGNMIRKLMLAAVTGAAALAVALGGNMYYHDAAHAATAPHVNSVANGVNVTTNNGVAGYYSFGSRYHNLEFDATTAVAAENMIPNQDGVGGQLCNNGNGKTVGAGEQYNGDGTFRVVVGIGRLNGNAAAHPVSSRANKCLGGIVKGLVASRDCIFGAAEQIGFRRRVALSSTKPGVDAFASCYRGGNFVSIGHAFGSLSAALTSISSSISCSSHAVQPFEILTGLGNSPEEHSLQMVGALRPTFSTTCQIRRVLLPATSAVIGISSELGGDDHR
jgi:hypothetical protein